MGIKIESNLEMFKQMINISSMRLNGYTDQTVNDVMESEESQGTQNDDSSSGTDLQAILHDTSKLIEYFQLGNAQNKIEILLALNTSDLVKFLSLLDKEDLVIGLQFFNLEKLLELLKDIPKEEMVKLVFEIFSIREVLEFLPDDSFNKTLNSEKMDRNLIFKYMEKLNPKELAMALEKATGKPVEEKDPKELTKMFRELDDQSFKRAIVFLKSDEKRNLVRMMGEEDPKIYELFDNDAYVSVLQMKEKPEIIKGSFVLKEDTLIKMLEELPQDLLAVVISQIDTSKFAEKLIAQYQNILSELIAS